MKLSEPKRNDDPAEVTQWSMRPRATPILSIGLVWLLTIGGGTAQESPATEYQLKAAFLLNFARFIEWPQVAFPETNSPMFLGVLGKNPFGDTLERTVLGKTVNTRPVRIMACASPAEATNCHMLFICTSEKEHLREALAGLHGTTVLTVGETPGFIEAGGMINFVWNGKKIGFQINEVEANSAHLKISSKLLSLAAH